MINIIHILKFLFHRKHRKGGYVGKPLVYFGKDLNGEPIFVPDPEPVSSSLNPQQSPLRRLRHGMRLDVSPVGAGMLHGGVAHEPSCGVDV